MAAPRLLLASASPRRLDLLAQLGLVPDQVSPADLDERALPDERPDQTAKRLAAEKARVAAGAAPDRLCLAADTVVALGRRALPKAEDEAAVAACLSQLSGRSHSVWTAVSAVLNGSVRTRLVGARVTFKRLTRAEIEAYAAHGEGLGKAGGYAIQGRAGAFVSHVSGSYTAIVGLPLLETANLLESFGLPVRSKA